MDGTVKSARLSVLRTLHMLLKLLVQTSPECLETGHVEDIPVLMKECLVYASFLCVRKFMELFGRELVLGSAYLDETFATIREKLMKTSQQMTRLPVLSQSVEPSGPQGRQTPCRELLEVLFWLQQMDDDCHEVVLELLPALASCFSGTCEADSHDIALSSAFQHFLSRLRIQGHEFFHPNDQEKIRNVNQLLLI
ncbi:hypothetical protein GUITHDRAFT_106021 [Guillardia theta CCMP2712]|uniref:Uncharacterized protein n=1 Tax=Guillardia theta (strain CCMP2712) TaxID=905079 RepID=L1JJD6_GUITC|nr:hypothetical protein GUITHDRAFT_106021 [Guillardia theta CCMP2712]EKX48417.1 hypothetical protein GUITHDRAFT_106021 [Guillardia theta CCMP2712]|eukprot:XP_005835397.1 hypothetical protein GUITHDRAFT_106021 [Guillardia theta CCMP2712]